MKKLNANLIKLPLFNSNSTHLLMTFLLVVAAFFIGSFWTKIQYLEKDKAVAETALAAAKNPVQDPQQPPAEDMSPKQVSIDDDAVLGSKNAKVTMIDFSDYECPFCKRYFDQTFSQIKKEYIDTGKIKYVYRDLPLSFHQNAAKEAEAAECAREQGGDEVYFKYHDEMFKRTTSNGTGLALDQLPVIANELGLDGSALQSCLDSGKYKSEVDKDLADASKVGASGTPTFFIGKSESDGVITGNKIVGAQSFTAFKIMIDQQLK